MYYYYYYYYYYNNNNNKTPRVSTSLLKLQSSLHCEASNPYVSTSTISWSDDHHGNSTDPNSEREK